MLLIQKWFICTALCVRAHSLFLCAALFVHIFLPHQFNHNKKNGKSNYAIYYVKMCEPTVTSEWGVSLAGFLKMILNGFCYAATHINENSTYILCVWRFLYKHK